MGTGSSSEIKPEEKEIENLRKDLADVNTQLKDFKAIEGETQSETNNRESSLIDKASEINGKIIAIDLKKQAKKESKEKKNTSAPTQKELESTLKGWNFFSWLGRRTPKESAANLAKDPKTADLLNSTVKEKCKNGVESIEKNTSVKPTSTVRTALVEGGSNIDKVNDDNANSSLNTIVQNPGFIATMKEYASSFGSHFISKLPLYMILGVAIAILVLIAEGKLTPAAAVQAAAQQLSGCYMIYGDGKDYNYIKLDGCSDWYSQNTSNLLNCRCNNIDDVSKAIDCKGNDKDLPYCIGAADDTSPGQKKCINPNDKNTPPSALLKCQGEVGQSGTFVRYTSNFEDVLGIISKLITLVEVTGGDTTDTTNVTNVTKNSIGMVGKILIGVVIIVTVLILGIIIYNTFFQNRNMIK